MRVTRKSSASDFSAELRHFVFAQSAFEIGARINAGSSMTLQVDVIANQRSRTATEKVIEANLEQHC